jgi:cell division protein FtsI/penicillin-binding protein 2
VGEYPPGSTFKVVSGYALLARGFTPDTVVPCPTSTVIDGKPFRNFEGEARGAATLATDFAISCNTAFVNMSAKLSGADLVAAARAFGLTIPSTATPLDVAAATIGQGRDLVTPLAMALVAAAVDAGTWRPPLLVTSPPQPAGPPPRSLDPHRLAVLRTLMGLVVSRGTAAAAGLPAGTAGKTGTAEFGAASPPATHAWFIGYRGDLAVAVIVEGGGVGGAVAAPIAARFLRSVGGG